MCARLYQGRPEEILPLVAARWREGLIYMGAVMGILLAHEMGHVLAALWHRVPASLPYFIPMPLTPLGTMGAVIVQRDMLSIRHWPVDEQI